MHIVREGLKALGCFTGILLTCDVLLTLHDIRNELRASRKDRERRIPYRLS